MGQALPPVSPTMNEEVGRRKRLPLEFLHFSGSGSAYELLFCCLELEFLQKLGVFGHFLA